MTMNLDEKVKKKLNADTKSAIMEGGFSFSFFFFFGFFFWRMQ
jgi:hypothetical protein